MKRNFEIISIYTDQQALDDGILIDISRFRLSLNRMAVNRITDNLFRNLAKGSSYDAQRFRNILIEKLSLASVPDDAPKDGYMFLVPFNLWAIRNKVGGYTLMYPEDY